MNGDFTAFTKIVGHPLKFRLFLLSKLPSAYFCGVRIKSITETTCEVTIPYKWFTKNPFRSTYFACLAMAAEISTGALGLAFLYKRKPAVSMLVLKQDAAFYKKATGITTFTCNDGAVIKNAIEQAIATNEPQTVIAGTEGKNEAGETVAVFHITWTFKARAKTK